MLESRAVESAPASATPAGATSPVALERVAVLVRGLDGAQRSAVTHGEGPLLVVAGPGTGKTRVVTRRIAWLIATKRARPSEILALTFTDAAAGEMQARVDELVPYGFADTAIHTFHAFGDRVVRDHAFELGLPGEPRVLSRSSAAAFVRARLFELELQRFRPLGDPARFVGALVALFGRAKDEGVSPARYVEHARHLAAEAARARRLASDDAAREAAAAEAEAALQQAELARAYERYEELRAAAGWLDFGDQIALATHLLRTRPDLRLSIRARYRYVLVDEFQDTNPAQLDLLGLLCGTAGNLTAVGDDDQSIYTFRGAAVGNLLGFSDRFPSARTVVLRRNYRSRGPILAAAGRLIAHNEPGRLGATAGIDKTLVARRRSRPRPVVARCFATPEAEADWVAGEIQRRVRHGLRPGDAAILVRTNRDAEPFLRSLDAAGIAWRFSRASGLYGRPEVRQLLAFLRTVADPDSTLDLYALATAEPYGLGGLELTSVLEAARRRHRSLWQVLLELQEQPGLLRLSAQTRRTLARLVADVREAVELGHQRPAGEVLYHHLVRSGRLARLAARGSEAEGELQAVARFFGLLREQSAALPDDRVACLVPHLAGLVEGGDEPLDGDEEILTAGDAVYVLTVHKAKGREFPLVFVVGLAEGRFPGRGRRDLLALPEELCASLQGAAAVDVAPYAEERRLAYVAMTRARDELVLTWARGSGRRSRRPSPFLAEALDGILPATSGEEEAGPGPGAVDRLPPAYLPAEVAACAPRPLPRPASPGRPRPGPLELSFSQLDSYLTCPLQYRYRYVLGLPIQPHHALVYGAALHTAVAAYHASERRGRPLDEAGLLDVFAAAWTAEGFLSRAHEEARFAAGQTALRRFRVARLGSGEPPPAAVEAPFSVLLGGNRIRGRYDRVDQTAEGAVITDYKSSDVREPEKARRRARDSLQLAVYALAHQAQAGSLPAALQLHFLDSGIVGRVGPDVARLAQVRDRIAAAADGIRAGRFEAEPDFVTCSGCPVRPVCPASAA